MFDTPSSSQDSAGDAVIAVVEAPPEKEKRRDRTENKRKLEPNYHVILWNDDDHSPEYVIEMMVVLFGHSVERSLQIAKEVHRSGKSVTWTCHRELAELKCDQILGFGADWRLPEESMGSMSATIEPAPE